MGLFTKSSKRRDQITIDAVDHPAGYRLPLISPRTFTRSSHERPRLQWAESWFNLLIVIAAPVTIILIGAVVAATPLVPALIITPAAVMLASLVWLDRAEPTPGRAQALLWGSTAVVAVALALNSLAGMFLDYSLVAVTTAPVVEEIGKALLFCFIVARRHVESPLDGAVLVSWASAGFALVEDVAIFGAVSANGDGSLSEVFVLRGILTPFAHLLFSVWIGLAVGDAIERRLNRRRAALQIGIALFVAIGLHAAWNAMAVGVPQAAPRGVLLALFFALLITTATALVGIQRRESAQFAAVMGGAGGEIGLRRDELVMFTSIGAYHSFRKYLPMERRRLLAEYSRTLRRFVRHESGPVPTDELGLLDHEARRRQLVNDARRLQNQLYADT